MPDPILSTATFPRLAVLGSSAPSRFFVQGSVPESGNVVAIVGSRRASREGCAFAHRLAGDLASAGWVVISGGAVGIDAAAHTGAMDAGGKTLAILGSGLSRLYPPEHASLFERISNHGALVTEYEDLAPPRRFHFLARNRLLAALADAVVIVQAPFRSGALSTAAHARKLGRRLFAVPASPLDPLGEGCNALLERGASICTSARHVLSVAADRASEGLGGGPQTTDFSHVFDKPPLPKPRRSVPPPVVTLPDDPDAARVFGALGQRPVHVDALVEETGLTAAAVQRSLVLLLLSGCCEEPISGHWVRSLANHGVTERS